MEKKSLGIWWRYTIGKIIKIIVNVWLKRIIFSVSILIYNVTRNVLIFVRQFRPGIRYFLIWLSVSNGRFIGLYVSHIPEEDRSKPICTKKYPAELGITIELCAGIVDKDKSLIQIAKEEVMEECGYDVPLEKIQKVHSWWWVLGY